MSAPALILSPTQLKESGKNLHRTPEYQANPHKAIMDFVAPFVDKIHVGPAKLLLATYRQPEKTAGGLYKTEKYIDEDMYQGITSVVIKLGPLCFESNATVDFGGFKPQVGDWVMCKPENARATELRGLHCRLAEDINIEMKIDDPELLF